MSRSIIIMCSGVAFLGVANRAHALACPSTGGDPCDNGVDVCTYVAGVITCDLDWAGLGDDGLDDTSLYVEIDIDYPNDDFKISGVDSTDDTYCCLFNDVPREYLLIFGVNDPDHSDEITANWSNIDTEVWAGDGPDEVYGANGASSLIYGEDGDDTLWDQGTHDSVVYGGEGSDTIRAFGGNDWLFAGDVMGDDGDVGTTNYLYGGEGADHLYGAGGSDSIRGEAGGDTLHGWEGPDTLCGGNGMDALYGEGGSNDWVWGGPGDDIVNHGGDGFGDICENDDPLYCVSGPPWATGCPFF